MKKTFAFLLALVMVLALTSCGGGTTPAGGTKEPSDEAPNSEDGAPAFEPMTLTFSMTEAEGGTVAQGMDIMKAYISEATGGAVTVDTYYASSLMAQDMEIESIMKGTLSMNACWFDWLAPYMEKLNVLNVPYLFSDWNHMQSYFESEQAAALCDEIAKTTGVHVFTPVYYKGARCVNLTKDIKVTSRADLNGVKIRMPGSEAWQNMGTALGANPVPLGVSELYLALQTGSVDGQDNGFATTRSFSFHEVTKSVTVTNHMIGAGFVTINESIWQSMSPELQKIVAEGVAKGCSYITETTIAQEADDVAFFEEAGVKVYYLEDEELAAYRKEVTDYYFAQENWVKDLDMNFYNSVANMNA